MFKKIVQLKLNFFAKAILKKYNPEIIGITGSVGKTSAKEAVYAVLASKYKVRRNKGNYNNEFGLPLTIIGKKSGNKNPFKWCGIFWKAFLLWVFKDKNYPEILVLEMGADHPGDIDYLTKLAPCRIGIITAVAPVHTEYFGSIDAVIQEKSILVKKLPKDGMAILNYDDANVHSMSKTTKTKLVTFGFENGADLQALEIRNLIKKDKVGVELGEEEIARGISFKINYQGNTVPIYLPGVLGRGHIYAALAGAAVGISHDMNLIQISEALEKYSPPKGRMNIIKGIRHTTLIDDSYNSSPVAAMSALGVLRDLPTDKDEKHIAVLGDMLELGEYTEEGHRRVGATVAEYAIDTLITVGEAARFIADEARLRGMDDKEIFSFDYAEEAGKFLQDRMERGDMILIKGSQGVRMEKIVKEVMDEPLKACDLLVRQDKSWECR